MFGAPSFSGFGQQNQQGNAGQPSGGGLFGQAQQPSNTFGSSTFGQSTGSAFGASQPGTAFGQAQQPQPQPSFSFGQTSSSFGAPKPPTTGFGSFGSSTPAPAQQGTSSFGFGSTPQQPQPTTFGSTPGAGGGAFGAQPPSTGSFFGQSAQPSQPSVFGGFGASVGAQPSVTQGSATTPYAPYREDLTPTEPKPHAKNWEVHQSISSMPAYTSMSQEELRLQDYRQGRQKGTAGPGAPSSTPSTGFGFGGGMQQPQPQQPQGGLFGQPSQPSGGGLFGQPQQPPQPQGTSMFGQQSQPSGGGLFGQQNNAGATGGGLFGSKPAGSAFGASTGGGAGGGLFGQSTTQPSGGGLFGQASQPSSTGFSFGANNNQQQQQQQPPSTGFSFGANNQQQQNKPMFGGFGTSTSQPQQPGGSGFTFGAGGTGTGGFGSGSSGFTFGANNNNNNQQQQQQQKPGGLFGSSSTPSTGMGSSFGGFGTGNNAQNSQQQNKPAFSFGGFGAGGSQPSQPSAGTGGGGLFGSQPSQPSTGTGGGLFGSQPSQPSTGTGGGLFGSQPNQSGAGGTATSGFGSGGGLFGAKPAGAGGTGGGLFGQSQPSGTSGTGGGGLFGNNQQQNKPAFSFGGGTGGAAGSGTGAGAGAAGTGGGLFGSQPSQPAAGGGGGLFGQSQPAGTGSGLFGQSQPAGASGGGLFGSSFNKPLGASAPAPGTGGAAAPPAAASPASLTTNPYGTDALLGNVALPAGAGAAAQAPLPFNVAPKNKPPLVSPFRSSPRNAVRVTRLRGGTPALDSLSPSARERTPGTLRESTPGGYARTRTPGSASSAQQLFRGPSDAQTLSPQAFLPRSTSKRLILDGAEPSFSSPSARRETTPFDGGSLPRSRSSAAVRARFSPAVERLVASGEADTSASFGWPDADESAALNGSVAARARPPRAATAPAPEPARAPAEGEYFTEPPLAQLRTLRFEELAQVREFVVGRVGCGKVRFLEPVDLSGMPDLGDVPGGVVQLRPKECFVYPQAEDLETEEPLDGLKPGYVPVPKAPEGTGLNVPAQVSLERCWPLDRATRAPLTGPENARVKQHIQKLRKKAETEFVAYDAASGTWTFNVSHFSRYGLDDTDESETEELREASDDGDGPPAAPLAGDGMTSDSGSSAMRESELMSPQDEPLASDEEEPEAWVPRVRRSVTPAVAARLRSHTPGAEPRKVQVMRASFFGQPPPARGTGGGVRTVRELEHAVPESADATLTAADVAGAEDAAPADGAAGAAAEPAPEAPAASAPPPIPLALPAASAAGALADPGAALARGARAGWGPGAVLAHRDALYAPAALSTTQVRLTPLRRYRDAARGAAAAAGAEKLLRIQLEATEVVPADARTAPLARPRSGTSFASFAQHFAADDGSYEAQLWHLGHALFDVQALGLQDAPPALAARVEQLRRKAAFSAWLQRAVAPAVHAEARAHVAASRGAEHVFALLSGHQVEAAADAALDAGLVHLATLVAQAGGDEATQADLREQLAVWRAEGADEFLDPAQRRVYEVLAGETSASGRGAAVTAGLDWKRALGVYVWYAAPFEAPLRTSVELYEAALEAFRRDTAAPLPHYCTAAQLGALRMRELERTVPHRDAAFELLKLHVDAAHPLEEALDPRGFAPSACDYALPWHVYVLLARALQQREFADANAATGAPAPGVSERGARLTLDYAEQLEHAGHWCWAALVLLYLEDDAVRTAAVHALLERHVEALDAAEAFLVDTLQVPRAWLWRARAIEAHARGDMYQEHRCWLEAHELDAAHRVAVRHLAAEAVVRGDQELLTDLFRPFRAWEERALAEQQPFHLQGWNEGGRVYLDYATLPRVLPALLARAHAPGAPPAERAALEQAIARVHELLELVPALHPHAGHELTSTVARSEMLVVLHNLARLVANHTQSPHPAERWHTAEPPEVEQLQASATDYAKGLLAAIGPEPEPVMSK